MQTYLSDETWQRLDPASGRLTRRGAWTAAAWVTGGVLAIVLGLAAVTSGALVPQVGDGGTSGSGYVAEAGTFHHGFQIVNEGRFALEVVSVGRTGPGLAPVALPADWADPPAELPSRLAPGEKMWVAVSYRVTDCDAVPTGPWPVPVRVSRPWGTYTVWIERPRWSADSFDLPPRYLGPSGDPLEEDIEWQRHLANAACHYHAGGDPWRWHDVDD